jgi:hypothetical protein
MHNSYVVAGAEISKLFCVTRRGRTGRLTGVESKDESDGDLKHWYSMLVRSKSH